MEAAESFDHRMHNIYKEQKNRSWLSVDGEFEPDSYYIDTTVRRFLAVITAVRRFEVRALHIDPVIVRRADFAFVSYCKILRWTMTDTSLFDGLDYDSSIAKDHYFADVLRATADEVIAAKAGTMAELKAGLTPDSACWSFWRFFDGINPEEDRLRWDRLVCFHLAVMLLLRTYGYPMQRPSKNHIRQALTRLRHPQTAQNMGIWVRRHGLKRSEARLLRPRLGAHTSN